MGFNSLYKKTFLSKFPLILIILFSGAALVSAPAFATLKITGQEKAVFAFFKLANSTPNYTKWIKRTPEFLKLDKDAQPYYFKEEDVRLKWGFGTYNVKKDFLKIQTNVLVRYEGEKGQKTLKINLPDFPDAASPFFPYPYGQDWIALIVSDLDKFTTIPIDQDHEEEIKKYISSNPEKTHRAILRMRLRPLSADSRAPLELNNASHWLLLSDTAYVSLEYYDEETSKPVVLWDYTAPWYLSETERNLLEILKE